MFNNKNKLIIIFASLVLFSIFPPSADQPRAGYFSAFGGPATGWLFSIPAEAASPLKLQIQFPCPDFPGANCPASPEKAAQSPAAYIARLYQFALMLAGMLAFGMIIYGAIQYTVSAGNTTQQSDARDRITQALWGVALLLGAYLILRTIDPKLVNLKDPDIKLIEINSTSTLGAADTVISPATPPSPLTPPPPTPSSIAPSLPQRLPERLPPDIEGIERIRLEPLPLQNNQMRALPQFQPAL
ncbi:MAG: hypothetical protein AAB404_00455 [Patescibacteria group bacterium]